MAGQSYGASDLEGHRTELERIGAALAPGAEILLYGCNTGRDGSGQALVDTLARLTGHNVAASDNDTGAASLGGDWVLERHSGAIMTAALDLSAWPGLLYTSTAILDWTTAAGLTLGVTQNYAYEGSSNALQFTIAGSGAIYNDYTTSFTGGTGDQTTLMQPGSTSTATGQTVTMLFNASGFPDGIKTVAFDLTNIDASTGSWDDRLLVTAFDTNNVQLPGSAISATPRQTSGQTYSITTLANGVQLDGNIDGTGTPADDNPQDTVALSITSTTGANIGRVVVLYTSGTSGISTGIVGISDVTMTYNAPPKVKVQKISLGGTSTFLFSGATNLASTPASITTTTSGTAAPVSPVSIRANALNTDVTITEAATSGYTLTGFSCTDANSVVTGNAGSFGTFDAGTRTGTIAAARVKVGADMTCVFTNTLTGPAVNITKTVNQASISSPGTLTYTITVQNGGNTDLTGTSLSDILTIGGSPISLTTGPTLSGDTNSDGILNTTETWTYAATYNVTAADISSGKTIVNIATFSTNEAGSVTASASTTTPGPTYACAGNNFASSNAISGVSGHTDCTNVGATGETGEPTTYGGGSLNTIWYSWAAPASGTVTFDLCDTSVTNFDTTLAAFTGNSVSALTQVAKNDDGPSCANFTSEISFAATSGTTYRLQVDGYGNATGNYRLRWFMSAPSAAISKSVDQSNVTAASLLSYTIIVSNTGNVALTSPALTDALVQNGSGQTLTSGPLRISGDANSNNILDTGEVWVYSATYQVTQANLDNGANLVNTATFTSALTSAVSSSTTTTLGGSPNLSIVKSATLIKAPGNTLSGVAQVGDTINYTYDVANVGTFTFTNVEVADVHNATGSFADPVHTSLTDNVPIGDSTDTNADPTIWGRLAPGDVAHFSSSYAVTQADQDTLY